MRWFPLLLGFLYGNPLALAEEVRESQVCAESINLAISLLSFSGSDATTDVCANRLRTYSLYAAIKSYCAVSDIRPGLDRINKDCREEQPRLPYAEIEPHLTETYLRSLRVVDLGEVSADEELETPVLISTTYFQTYYRTIDEWYFQTRTHRRYGFATYWFWGVALLLGSLYRLYDTLFSSRTLHHIFDPETHLYYSRLKGKSYLGPFKYVDYWARTHLLIPAAFGSHRQQLVWWCTVPTRLEAIVIVSYYILSLILSVSSYSNLFSGNAYYSNTTDQFWRYFSDRTGVLSYANLPLLWLFGGRNNVFVWATGWSYSTFNLFHRGIARIATIQAIAHSIGYTILTVRQETYAIYWPASWWYMGVVATIAMALLLGFSSIWLRRNYYEVFLILHIILSVITLIGLFVHTSIFLGKYEPYLWPILAIWCFDRFARLARLVCCNVYVQLNRREFLSTNSVISYSKGADILRLEVFPGSPLVHPQPGQHYYLYQPRKWGFYENHPFTLGSWVVVDGESEENPWPNIRNTVSCSRSSFPELSGGLASSYKFTFWIRPFDGWTRRLRHECCKTPDKTVSNARFLIEGPYGSRVPVYSYENVIFIAGGTGIAAALPYIQDIRRRSPAFDSKEHQRHPSPAGNTPSASLLSSSGISGSTGSLPSTDRTPCRTRKITLVWAARQSAFIRELATQELRPIFQKAKDGVEVYTRFYSTERVYSNPTTQQHQADGSDGLQPATETTSLLSPESLKDDHLEVDIQHGRPDIKQLVLDAVSEEFDRTAVLVCGPAGMADEARVAVHQALKGGTQGVHYFEETFDYILPHIHPSLASSSSAAHLQEQIQTLRTTYFDPYVLDPVNDLLTSATPNLLSLFFLLIILFISLRVLGYVFRMITFWVMLVVRLVFWAVCIASAFYVYTVGWERAARELGWVWGVGQGFLEDFQASSAGGAGGGDGAGWSSGKVYGGRSGGAYGGDAWGRRGRGL
ncbi:hypothetical protein FQN54_007131 [Arachnomyces sp. PD_36]|nr:hypothetical protein FQN54_007131 [Arachnomyces sp. PD_36]